MNKTTSSWCALFGTASANLIIYGFYVVLGINTIMVSPAGIEFWLNCLFLMIKKHISYLDTIIGTITSDELLRSQAATLGRFSQDH